MKKIQTIALTLTMASAFSSAYAVKSLDDLQFDAFAVYRKLVSWEITPEQCEIEIKAIEDQKEALSNQSTAGGGATPISAPITTTAAVTTTSTTTEDTLTTTNTFTSSTQTNPTLAPSAASASAADEAETTWEQTIKDLQSKLATEKELKEKAMNELTEAVEEKNASKITIRALIKDTEEKEAQLKTAEKALEEAHAMLNENHYKIEALNKKVEALTAKLQRTNELASRLFEETKEEK